MKHTDSNAMEIAKRGGAVPASEWITGSGKHIRKRPIPALCMEIDARSIDGLKGKSLKAARALLRFRPSIKKLVVVRDWRKLNKVAKAGKEE